MAFTLPSDLPTDWVDSTEGDETLIDATDWNNTSAMGNAVKAALATWGVNPKTATVATGEGTTSTSYVDLTTTTDTVTAAIGSSGKVLVILRTDIAMTTQASYGGFMSYEMSGANTSSATDTKSVQYFWKAAGLTAMFLEEGLNPGFTTFKLKYRTSANTATFTNRRITVIPFPATDGTHASATVPIDISSSLSLGMGGAGVNRPTYDSVGAGYKAGGGSGSWSHTIGADAKALLVYVLCNTGTGVTANIDGTTNLSALATPVGFTGGGSLWVWTFGLINPPTGAHTINVGNASSYLVANSVAYTNTVAFGSLQSNIGNSTTATQTVLTAMPGRTISHAFGSLGVQTDSSYTGTTRYFGWTSGSTYPLIIGDAPASTVTTTFTETVASAGWGGSAVELLPSVPTYSIPTWVGTGLNVAHHKTNPGYSWVETVPADANLALVWVSEMPSTQANTCTVTLGGTSMVEVTGSPWTMEVDSGYYMRTRCFALQNPTTGPNQTIAVTSNVSNSFHANSVYYGGVTSVGPAGSYARGAGGTTPTLAIPGSASNHLYAMCFGYRGQDNNSTFTAFSAGATMRAAHSNDLGGYTVPIGVGDAYGNDGTLTVTATRYNSTYGWNGIALDLSPSALPTPTTPTWVGTGAGRQHFAGNYSWTETVPANATCAIVTLGVVGNTACSITLGGTAMTALHGSPFTLYSGNYSTQTYYLLNPTTGSQTLSVTNTNGNNVHAIVTFYGGTAGVFNQTAITTGTGGQQPSIAMSNTLANHRYLTVFGFRAAAAGDAITAVNQGTLRMAHPNYSYDLPLGVSDAAGNGGTLTVTGTRSNTTYEWGGMIVDLSPDPRPSAAMNLALTPTIGMAGQTVTYDAAGSGTQGTSANGGTYTYTHTLDSGAKAILVAAMVGHGAANQTITAKIGTTDLTQLYQRWVYLNTWQLVVFGILDPPTGSQTISLILPSGTNHAYAVDSASYKGVRALGTAVSPEAAGSSPATQTVTTATIGGMIFHAFGAANNGSAAFSAYNQTQRAAISGATNSCATPLLIGDAAGAASVTFSATATNTGTYKWGSIAVPLNGYT